MTPKHRSPNHTPAHSNTHHPPSPQDAAPGQSRFIFYSITGTARLKGAAPGAPEPPLLCQVARGRAHAPPMGVQAGAPPAGELPQPGKGPEWGLDAGRAWRAQSVSCSGSPPAGGETAAALGLRRVGGSLSCALASSVPSSHIAFTR